MPHWQGLKTMDQQNTITDIEILSGPKWCARGGKYYRVSCFGWFDGQWQRGEWDQYEKHMPHEVLIKYYQSDQGRSKQAQAQLKRTNTLQCKAREEGKLDSHGTPLMDLASGGSKGKKAESPDSGGALSSKTDQRAPQRTFASLGPYVTEQLSEVKEGPCSIIVTSANGGVILVRVGGGISFLLNEGAEELRGRGLVTEISAQEKVVKVQPLLDPVDLLQKVGGGSSSSGSKAAEECKALLPTDVHACVSAISLLVPFHLIERDLAIFRVDELSKYMIDWQSVHKIRIAVLAAKVQDNLVNLEGATSLKDCWQRVIGE